MASRMHLAPAQVWGLDVDQWVVLASALDASDQAEREAIAKTKEQAR